MRNILFGIFLLLPIFSLAQTNFCTLSPEDFGAKGDGVSDDYKAFALLFEHIEANTIILQKNTLRRTAPIIQLRSGHIYHLSRDICVNAIQCVIEGNESCLSGGGLSFTKIGGAITRIRNVKFRGDANRKDYYAINFSEYSNLESYTIQIENCEFFDCQGGINVLRRSGRVEIKSCIFAVSKRVAHFYNCDRVTIQDCWIQGYDPGEDNFNFIDQEAPNEGYIKVENNIFVPYQEMTHKQVAWIGVEKDAIVRSNRFGLEHNNYYAVHLKNNFKLLGDEANGTARGSDFIFSENTENCTLLLSSISGSVTIESNSGFYTGTKLMSWNDSLSKKEILDILNREKKYLSIYLRGNNGRSFRLNEIDTGDDDKIPRVNLPTIPDELLPFISDGFHVRGTSRNKSQNTILKFGQY